MFREIQYRQAIFQTFAEHPRYLGIRRVPFDRHLFAAQKAFDAFAGNKDRLQIGHQRFNNFPKNFLAQLATPFYRYYLRRQSFFHLLKSGRLKSLRIRRNTYATRKEARQDVFDYIALFYNPKRKHGKNGMLSPIDYERQEKMKLQSV